MVKHSLLIWYRSLNRTESKKIERESDAILLVCFICMTWRQQPVLIQGVRYFGLGMQFLFWPITQAKLFICNLKYVCIMTYLSNTFLAKIRARIFFPEKSLPHLDISWSLPKVFYIFHKVLNIEDFKTLPHIDDVGWS